MPRISFTSPAIEGWSRRTGNGSSTFDICRDCLEGVRDYSDLQFYLDAYNGEPIGPDATVVVENFRFDDEELDAGEYHCEICSTPLKRNNY